MWLKSKSIPKVNSSILNVFEPKFSIFAKQQYPSFSTSIQRNVATWGLWYANTFVDFFPTIMINILKRFVFASFNMCHWSFPAISRLKRFAVTSASSFFRPDFQWVDFFSYDHCERTKNLLLILLIRLKKATISVDMLYDEKHADIVFFTVRLLISLTISPL